ncbi:hypothetical protein K4K51_007963 [Colletotrichum sp. SAR 10_75]|nr:hypothetical protein K4K51_007963 [Colletotrichum sp. SAR 10_75]
MSANDYYGGSRRNSHTPGSRSSKTYLSTPLVDQAGYYPELDVPLGERPRSAMANRSKFGNGYHSRSRSTGGGPPGSDAQLGTGKEGERGLLSTIGGGAAGGFAGKKLLGGGKLGTAAGALGGAVIANKIEHRISGSHHHSSSHRDTMSLPTTAAIMANTGVITEMVTTEVAPMAATMEVMAGKQQPSTELLS